MHTFITANYINCHVVLFMEIVSRIAHMHIHSLVFSATNPPKTWIKHLIPLDGVQALEVGKKSLIKRSNRQRRKKLLKIASVLLLFRRFNPRGDFYKCNSLFCVSRNFVKSALQKLIKNIPDTIDWRRMLPLSKQLWQTLVFWWFANSSHQSPGGTWIVMGSKQKVHLYWLILYSESNGVWYKKGRRYRKKTFLCPDPVYNIFKKPINFRKLCCDCKILKPQYV